MSRLLAIPCKLKAPALLACMAATVIACDVPASSPARGNINVVARSLRATGATTLRLTLQSSTVLDNPLKIPVMVHGDESTTLIRNLSVADNYVLTADALDANQVIRARGTVTGVSIVRGRTTEVIIYLNQVTEPPPFGNSSPLIDGILLSADAALPGGQVALRATAHDPDAGQTATLAFSWVPAPACGTITEVRNVAGTDKDHPSESLTAWIAPQQEGSCQITLAVKDVLGLSTSASFVVRVGAARETGAATVSTVFNDPPEIIAITATPAQLTPGGPTSGVIEVMTRDSQNDSLNYAWSSDPNAPCTVVFAGPTEANTVFTATPTQADASYCTFTVTVDDGVWPDTGLRKGTLTSSLVLAIAPPLVTLVTPAFSIAYQSHDIATGGTVVWFGAMASDPEGGTLSYVWSASSGQAPEATTPTLLGLDPAFATAATWTVPSGAENMTSDLVVTVTATSSTSNLASATHFNLRPANQPEPPTPKPSP